MDVNGLLNGSGPAEEAQHNGYLPQQPQVESLAAEETGGLPSLPPAGIQAAAAAEVDAPMPLPAQEALDIHQSQDPTGALYSDKPATLGMPGTAGELEVAPEPSQDAQQPFGEMVQEPNMSVDIDQPLPATATSFEQQLPVSQPVLESEQHQPVAQPEAQPLPSAHEIAQVAAPAEAEQASSLPEQVPTQQVAAKSLHQPPLVEASPVPNSATTSEMPNTAASLDPNTMPSLYPPAAHILYPPVGSPALPPSATDSVPPSALSHDVHMTDLPETASPADVNMLENGVAKRSYDGDEAYEDPPAKRQKHSASASPGPQYSSQPAYAPTQYMRPPVQMSKEQSKYCQSILRSLKKSRDAPPFLMPVDPIALGIPHYPNVITHPMDLGTIEHKLQTKQYPTVDDFTSDMRLMINNCYKFNGETSPVGIMAKGLETMLNKQLQKMPVFSTPATTPLNVKPKKQSSSRRQSETSRPKREIHAPAPYDDEVLPTKKRKSLGGSIGPSAADSEMKFCKEVLKEVMKKGNQEFNWIFLNPVDPVALGIPDYFNIIKKPMDLGTMKSKLDAGAYRNSTEFYNDFKLIVKNCQTYNAAGSNPHILAAHLDHAFDQKWSERAVLSDDSGSDSDEAITMMENQIEMIRAQLDVMRAAKEKRRAERRIAKQAQVKAAKAAMRNSMNGHANLPPLPTLPPPPPKQPKAPRRSLNSTGGGSKRRARKDSDDEEFGLPPDEEVTWGMKQELANSMGTVSGERLEQAIDIIRKARPDLLGDGQEIELDIDSLDTGTLLKLYKFAVGKPNKQKGARRESTLTASGHRAHKGGRAGTGGLKGKSLDEDQESAHIAELEARLLAFEATNGGAAAAAAPNGQAPALPGPAPSLPAQTGPDDDAMGSDSSSDASDSDSDFD